MPRPDFSISLPNKVTQSTNSNPGGTVFTVPDDQFCSEDVTGQKRRKPKGWIPPTGYYLLRREYRRAYGSSHASVSKDSWTKYVGCVGSSPGRFNSLNHFNEVLTEATALTPLNTSKALVKARLKLKDGRVNLGVAFGERNATARMLGDNATSIAKALRSLRRGKFRDAARALGIRKDPGKPRGSNITNQWLQLQYGWKPLLSDVYGACDALSKRDKGDWRVTVKASDRDLSTYINSRAPSGTSGPTGNFDARLMEARRERGVFVRVDALPDNDLTMSLASLGVTNPLLVAWELVPYSFVFDWFLPVGDWLDSLDALLGYGQAWSSVTTYNNVTWQGTGLSKVWSKYAFVKNEFTESKRVLKVSRTANSGVPLPPLPRFNDRRSLGHMANGLSLLAGACGRTLPRNYVR